MQIVRELNDVLWREFVEETPGGNIFHTPEMFHTFQRARGYSPSLWAMVHEGKPAALFLPVNISHTNGILRRWTTRTILYGGVLCASGQEGAKALEILLREYRSSVRGDTVYTELRPLRPPGHLQSVLLANRFAYDEYLNIVIDLDRPVDEIMEQIGRRTRKKIRRALRDDYIRVLELKDRKELGPWYEMLQETYRRARVPLADRSLFEAAFDELQNKGMAKFFCVRVKDELAACSLELAFKDTIYGWYGGSNRDFSNYCPNEVLIWRVLEWAALNGYREYDFGGAGKPGEDYGVRDFKSKFGGKSIAVGRNRCIHAPLTFELGKLAYAVYRRSC
jgi:CelD/BcsL family acetyltransferase involved in cellulose biosynthesis